MKALFLSLSLILVVLTGCAGQPPLAYDVVPADEPDSGFQTQCVQDAAGNWSCSSRKTVANRPRAVRK